jgi:hypothetical protein
MWSKVEIQTNALVLVAAVLFALARGRPLVSLALTGLAFNGNALHCPTQGRILLGEELVSIAAYVASFSKKLETVDLELTLEGSQLGLAEVLGHHFLEKCKWVMNAKGIIGNE